MQKLTNGGCTSCWVVFLTMLLSLASAQSTQKCRYNMFASPGKVHTGCLPPNASCDIINSGVNKANQDLIVRLHNNLRSRVAAGNQIGANNQRLPAAADMRQLRWKKELASLAQARANQCNLEYDCFECRRVEEYPTGEIMYYYFNRKGQDWNGVIKAVSEDSKKLTSVQGGQYGINSFTQMIWATTRDIGCGFTEFRGRQIISLYVCLYGPPGNYPELDIYETGPACSDCSFRDTCCDSTCNEMGSSADYPGLCKLI